MRKRREECKREREIEKESGKERDQRKKEKEKGLCIQNFIYIFLNIYLN